jgi:hypothetical protein
MLGFAVSYDVVCGACIDSSTLVSGVSSTNCSKEFSCSADMERECQAAIRKVKRLLILYEISVEQMATTIFIFCSTKRHW